MKRIVPTAAAVFSLCAMLVSALLPASAQNPSVSGIISRMVAADNVRSYTASVHADIAMHSFPFLSPSLDGTYYHKEPSKNKIVFTSGLPFIAKQFSKVYPEVESPANWMKKYYVSLEAQDTQYTTLKLVPRKHGRIDHIDAKIDNATADLVQLRWDYNDGGYATLNQTYSVVDGHRLVTAQSGHFEVPHYNADLKSTFTAFKINASIPDSIFSNNG
ncbi:MAG TPA: hypothetical protein VFH72_13565 [Candidatus Baltobacteraceae bacterium]|jgi:hypothetical protein|nr:hypothetical protein [Candidatus Baltobacteraceae bacterium]